MYFEEGEEVIENNVDSMDTEKIVHINFATTTGLVFQSDKYASMTVDDDDSITSEYTLGQLIMSDDGIIIIDRHPNGYSRLNIDDTIDTLWYILKQMYSDRTKIIIQLPKMQANMYEEANIQKRFNNISDYAQIVYL